MGGDFNLGMDVRGTKKEETRQRIEIRFRSPEHNELAGPDRCVANPKSRR